MTERLEDQIQRYASAIDADARPVEDLIPAGMAAELGVDRTTIEISVPLTGPLPERRVPGWVWGIAAAIAVLALALPLLVLLDRSNTNVATTVPTPSTTEPPLEIEGLVRNPANGHYYGAVAVPSGITWGAARAAAATGSADGVRGHLATFTSAEEYGFVGDHLPEAFVFFPDHNPYWLGGFQPPGSVEPDGGWQWVTGEPFTYTDWAPGEPNDSVEGEDCLHPHHSPSDSPAWNDQPCDDATVRGYIVEYDTAG